MSSLAQKFKTKKTTSPSKKLVRLPDGTLYKCDKKIREHNINDLRVIARRINFDRDAHFFFISKNADEYVLLPSCFPRNASALLDHISRIYFLYHLSELSVAKCLSLENPKDLTDTNLLHDVVLTNRNNLQSNSEDANAAQALLESEEAVLRLLTTLLSLPELTTQWYRVKDQNGKVYQLGITTNGLVIRPEFDGTEINRIYWTELGVPRVQRSNVRIPLKLVNAVMKSTFSSFMELRKNKQFTLSRRKPSQSPPTVRAHGDTDSSREVIETTNEDVELVFYANDSSTAKRLTYQLNCARTYALGTEQTNMMNGTNQTKFQPGPFARLNRQFRDTFRRVAKPFSKKSKKHRTTEEQEASADELEPEEPQSGTVTAQVTQITESKVVEPSGDVPRVSQSDAQVTHSTGLPTCSSAAMFTNQMSHTASVTTPTPAWCTTTMTNSTSGVTSSVLSAGSITTTTGTANSSTITQTFHVSHDLPHGTSFQTHGSVMPVLSSPRSTAHESPVEPIGVVAAGEADFSLDECEDRMLHSMPSPLFESVKPNRNLTTITPGAVSSNAYSLGIKPTVINPVTPTSPSSMTSFGSTYHPQTTSPTRFDWSPVNDSTSVVSNALANCVNRQESPGEQKKPPEMDAKREFCTDILAKTLNPEPEKNPAGSVSLTTDPVVPSRQQIRSEILSTKLECSASNDSSEVTNSTTSVVIIQNKNCTVESKSDPISSTNTESLRSFTSSPSTLAEIKPSTTLIDTSPIGSSPVTETSFTTAVSHLQSFSSTTTNSYKSPAEGTTPATVNNSVKENVSPTSSPTQTSVSTFAKSDVSENTASMRDASSKLTGTAPPPPPPTTTVMSTCPVPSSGEVAASPSTSFQSRLRAPMVSVARPGAPSETDTWSRTPEFPSPYRPVPLHTMQSGLPAPKVKPSAAIHVDQTTTKTLQVQASHNSEQSSVSNASGDNAHIGQGNLSTTRVQDGNQMPTVGTGARISGIRPPSVKVPGPSPESPSVAHTRLVSTPSVTGNGTNGSSVASNRISSPEVHTSSQIKPSEIKVAQSGIKPPSITVPNSSPGSRATGIPVPASTSSNGSAAKNGSTSSPPNTTPPTGIRLPSRVPKPSTNRA